MTIALAWVATRPDGRQDLYLASDSRTRGAFVFDQAPKILALPRSDSAICFAGNTHDTYPFMLQVANAVSAHAPAQDRSLDLGQLKSHCLKIITDLVKSYQGFASGVSFLKGDATFILAGYSWRSKCFRIWTFLYNHDGFIEREATNFHNHFPQAAFIGDYAKKFRSVLVKSLNGSKEPTPLQPFRVLAEELRNPSIDSTIGGAPQLLRIGEHMNLRPTYVIWDKKATIFGRRLFEYENCHYWGVEPFEEKVIGPMDFGRRHQI